MKIKKGDTVVVISGEDKGEKGKILKVYPKEDKVLVEGINFVSRHTKPNQRLQTGGIIKKEAPIHRSNVMIWDDKSKSGTRIRIQRENEQTNRISVKSGKAISEPKFERGRRN